MANLDTVDYKLSTRAVRVPVESVCSGIPKGEDEVEVFAYVDAKVALRFIILASFTRPDVNKALIGEITQLAEALDAVEEEKGASK